MAPRTITALALTLVAAGAAPARAKDEGAPAASNAAVAARLVKEADAQPGLSRYTTGDSPGMAGYLYTDPKPEYLKDAEDSVLFSVKQIVTRDLPVPLPWIKIRFRLACKTKTFHVIQKVMFDVEGRETKRYDSPKESYAVADGMNQDLVTLWDMLCEWRMYE